MGTVHVTDRAGAPHQLEYSDGQKLMEVLRDQDMVRAECGGMQICATCHVLIHKDWYDVAGAASEDEADMLDGTGDYQSGSSRLSCQIEVSEKHDGMKLTLGPDL